MKTPLDLNAEAMLYIGTSGWAYPSWKPAFYPPKTPGAKFLSYYASQLSSVEVNYTFRALPTEKQLLGWLAETPEGFRFSFKAPQRITHFSRLRDCEADLSRFLFAIEPARCAGKLGMVLFQLPPNFKADADTRARLATLLAAPGLVAHRVAFEFRHESWFADDTYDILRQGNAALCIADSDDLVTPECYTGVTHAAFRLRRNGGYTSAELAPLAEKLKAVALTREVYAYLKHEDEPTGPLQAAALLAACRSGG
jgi:uncharacterized protein YecE (DUF72 family)